MNYQSSKRILNEKIMSNRSYSRGKVNNVIYNDRCGYALVFYDPIYDLDTKIAPLRVADLPYTIPLQRKTLRTLKPAGKPVSSDELEVVRRPKVPGDYEAAQDFIRRKTIERKMDEVREAFASIRYSYKKAEKFDAKRREVISPRVKAKIRGKSADEICDVLVDDVMQNVDYVYERNLEEKGKTQRKLALAALRRVAKAPKPIEKIHVEEPKLAPLKEEECAPEPTEKGCGSESKCSTCCCKKLQKKLKVAEKKFEEIPCEKFLRPSPIRSGLPTSSSLQRRHLETMSQRASDALLFEMTYGRMLRRLRNDIRKLKENYS